MNLQIACAICKKPVVRVVVHEELMDGLITVKVWCHGDTDSMKISRDELNILGQDGIDAMVRQGGVAFTGKRLAL